MGRAWVFKSVFSQSRDVRMDVRACCVSSFLCEDILKIGGLHPSFISAMLRTRDMQ